MPHIPPSIRGIFAFCFFLSIFCSCIQAQDPGSPYIRNYTPVEYDHYPQNWCIVQDADNGLIYVGNQAGLLEYDGVSWRIIYIPNLMVRAMALDEKGNLYVGGKEELGIFPHPEPENSTIPIRQYRSLTNHIQDKQKDFSIVQRIHRTSEGTYFRTSKTLFRMAPDSHQMSAWEPESRFHTSFVCNDTFYIRQVGVGLMHMQANQLKLLPGGELFADQKIYMMADYSFHRHNPPKILIGTRDHGFYIHDGKKTIPFVTPADDYLRQHKLYHGIRLKHRPGSFALATLRGGVIIMDRTGTVTQRFNKNTGLQDNTVYYVFEDNSGNLWLAMSNGITRIETASPFTVYDHRAGLQGLILSVTRHRPEANLYIGTGIGLFKYTTGDQTTQSFQRIQSVSGNCRDLLSTGNTLLAAGSDGLWAITGPNSQVRKILATPTYTIRRSPDKSHRIWIGNANGLAALKLSKEPHSQTDTWAIEHQLETIGESIGSIVPEKNGNLWLAPFTRGVIHVVFPAPGKIDHPIITRYNQSHGLPDGEINIFQAAGHIIFASEKGIYRFQPSKQRFTPDTTLGEAFCDGSHKVFRIVEDTQKQIWFHSMSRNYLAVPQPDGSYRLSDTPFRRMPLEQVNTIFPEKNMVWFAGNGGLVKYDKRIKKNYQTQYTALIREVSVNGNETLYSNKQFRYKSPDTEKNVPSAIPQLQYNQQNIRFRYAAPFFENESATTYRYRLEGYDQSWSPWTSETQKDYTNLDAGTHRFRVQARNVYHHLSKEAGYEFKIIPHWSRTWWAFTLYAFLFLLLFYLSVRWRSAKLHRDKQKLADIVELRTREVNQTNLQLQEKSRQLEEMAQVKSRFFANISHEFRTPLTLIMGPLDQMISHNGDPTLQKKYSSMLRNSQRLLHLIDQLLELSKFESGKMKLHASLQDLIPFLKGILYSFELVMSQKQIQLEFTTEADSIPFYFDAEKLDKILCNLLSNAVKFTPVKGTITVKVSLKDQQILEITLHNTGSTIPADQLPHIFDRFYQAKSTHSDESRPKGSGIGLALVKELVTLHYGQIDACSDSNGTAFLLRLPIDKSHFKPEEIMDLPETYPTPTVPPLPLLLEQTVGETETREVPEIDMTDTDEDGHPRKKNLILVVEDNPEVRKYIAESLQEDFTLIEAIDGRDGLEKAGKYIPDLIISDIMMPRVDGFNLCRIIKQDVKTSHIPIILLTARASDENIIKGIETGADDYITKPFNTKILLARAKNLIDLRTRLQSKIKCRNLLQPDEISVSSVDELFLKDLHDVIEKHLSDSEFHVEDLSKKLYMSRATLYRKIMALTGESPNQFIRSYRLKRAKQLLNAKYGNVTEVAMAVGFTNMAYFSKCFKETFHQLPSNFSNQ